MEDLGKYQGLIRSIVWRTIGSGLSNDGIADVIQEVNLRLLDPARRPDFNPDRGERSSWIGSMARSMSIDALRKQSRVSAVMTSPWASDDQDCDPAEGVTSDICDAMQPTEDALTMMLREEQRSILSDIIGQLDQDDQHFLLISMRDDYDNEAYAERLGVKPVALRVRKLRLAEKLRKLLAATRT